MKTMWHAFPVRSLSALLVATCLLGCQPKPSPKDSAVGQPLQRKGDEIMVAGQLFHTGAPVVLWTDPGGYDAYRTERRFSSWDDASFARPPARRRTSTPPTATASASRC
jgi:hypothetical protein